MASFVAMNDSWKSKDDGNPQATELVKGSRPILKEFVVILQKKLYLNTLISYL